MEVRTGNFSLYPRYGKDGKINGWQGSTELVLEGKDFPRITSTAGKIQSLTMGSVSFALSYFPRPRVMTMSAKSEMAADAPIPVEAGKSTVLVTVSGSVQMK